MIEGQPRGYPLLERVTKTGPLPIHVDQREIS